MNRNPIEGFWAEMTPCEHFVQIYDADDEFLATLARFVIDGLTGGESVIVIATEAHRAGLDSRLESMGIDVEFARTVGNYIPLDAEEMLAKFLVDGWPDEKLFEAAIGSVLVQARLHGPRIRAFGEMVALMWANGLCGATVRLEHLWTDLCERETFRLFCAYPKIGFTGHPAESINHICKTHSQVISA